MSNEIQVTIQLTCTNGDLYIPSLGVPQQVDQTNKGGGLPGYKVIGLAEESIDLTDLTVPGYVFMKNMGSTGVGTGTPTLKYGPQAYEDTGTGLSMIPFGELKPGEEACFRLTTDNPTLILVSDEEDTGVQLCILED